MTTPRSARALVIGLAVGLLLVLTGASALARFRAGGAGGCGQFAESVAAAEAGDVLAPMRGGINTESVVISKTLVIQGGWIPDSGDCTSNGTDEFDDAEALLGAGFVYDPAERSEMFGNGSDAILPIDLRTGQTTVLQNLAFIDQFADRDGIALSGVISDGARLRLENLRFEILQAGVNGKGGTIYLEVRGGSQLIITNSEFINNNATSGGAIEVHLYDDSSLLIEGSSFTNNNALTENGGALRVLIERGSATLRGNTFTENVATNGAGGAAAFERTPGATGPASVTLINNSFTDNSATEANDIYADGVAVLEPHLYMPVLRSGMTPALGVMINSIKMSEAAYEVGFTTSGFTPQLPGQHIHFYFNTVPAAQAGMPGSGPWFVYGGSSPFTGYGIADRPKGATHLCALVANPDHSVIPGTGNCISLP